MDKVFGREARVESEKCYQDKESGREAREAEQLTDFNGRPCL